MYAGVDTARAGDVVLLEGEGIRVLVSRGNNRYERNVDYNQIRFYHQGNFEIDTELGHVASGPEWAKWGPTLRAFLDSLAV